jgi:hypothetical protein
MIRILLSFCIVTMAIYMQHTSITPFHQVENVQAEQAIPPYAKWGRLAMQKTKERYPGIDIVDYLHIGRNVQKEITKEKFKLWLRSNNKEFGVFITITFKTKNEEIVEITFKETNQ